MSKKRFLIYKENSYTYNNLIRDINNKYSYSSFIYIQDNNPYEIFLRIIHSLINDYEITLLDGDFSDREIKNIGIDKKELLEEKKLNKITSISEFENIIDIIKSNKSWKIKLYTSGTTGRPKSVSHSIKSLIRNIKIDDKFKDNIWAFAYNPTHMAGLQVFFQAFMNQNPIIYIFDRMSSRLSETFEEYNITNISATATFYKNIIMYLKNKQFNSVKIVTFGGEKYDSSIEKRINEVFPNAKVKNIYASTEAGSLFISDGIYFRIQEKNKNLIRVNNDNELLIHKELLGSLNAFMDEDVWFNTGDIVKMKDDYHFEFISRKTDMINIGGYKVNPLEVENILIKVPGIIDLVVKAKENRITGYILVMDVLKRDEFEKMELKKSIKKFAKENLQSWKIPRIINFVSEIPKNRAGKKVRI